MLAGLAAGVEPEQDRQVEVTAVVTTADDGGSSGELRRAYGVPAAGDVRNCLVALAEGANPLAAVFQHRFEGEEGLAGHTVGNLVLTALAQRLGRLLRGGRGRRRPPGRPGAGAARLRGPRRARRAPRRRPGGPWRVPRSPAPAGASPRCASRALPRRRGRRSRRCSAPTSSSSDPGASTRACSRASSPAGCADALRETGATRVLVVNLLTQPGETDGYTAADHLRAVRDHLGDVVDVALVHRGPLPVAVAAAHAAEGAHPVEVDRAELEALGAVPVVTDLLAAGRGRPARPRQARAGAPRHRAGALRTPCSGRPSSERRRAPPSRWRVDEVRGRTSFDRLRAEWDAVVARGPADVPFASHGWISAWLDAFAPSAAPLVLVARDAAGAPLGMAAFLEERRRGVVRLVAPANDHSCRVEWALGADAGTRRRRRCGATCATGSSWDVLLLRDVPRDGPTSVLLEPLARADRHPTGRWESLRTPVVRLGGGSAEERTSARFRANLRRRARRLQELGAVAVRRSDGAGDVDAALSDFLAVEASGWKGKGGTAIALDPALVRFYRAIARDAAARGALAIRTPHPRRAARRGPPRARAPGRVPAPQDRLRRVPRVRLAGPAPAARGARGVRGARARRPSTSSGRTCPGSPTGSRSTRPTTGSTSTGPRSPAGRSTRSATGSGRS